MNANTFCLECGYPSYLVTGSNPPRYAHDLPNGTNYSQHKALFPQCWNNAKVKTAKDNCACGGSKSGHDSHCSKSATAATLENGKWDSVYAQCKEFLAHPGEPSTKPIEWCVGIIDDLRAIESRNAELRRNYQTLLDDAVEMRCEKSRLRIEFEKAPAPHAGNRMMVRCTRIKNDAIVAQCWVEEHRIQPYSPTGVDRIIQVLKLREADHEQ